MTAARNPLRHFLLIFDHEEGRLVREPEMFHDVDDALKAYERCEEQYDLNSKIEVVLIGSDSIDTVQFTHANYFDGTAALSRELARIMQSPREPAE
jgi:hypothetical protein